MASSGQFEIVLGSVQALSEDFNQEASGVAGDAVAFGQGAGQTGAAFGILGACDGASKQYSSLLSSSLNALGMVAEALEGVSQQLGATVETYASNETQVRQNFTSVHKSF